jgi:hypothetical protein
MCNTCLIFHTLLWCTVHTKISYTAGLHLRLQYHLPPATRCNLSGQDSFTQLHVYSLYSMGRGFIHWEGYCYLFPDDLRSPNRCLHANARLWLPAFYSASKTLKQIPHTPVFPSHMVVIVHEFHLSEVAETVFHPNFNLHQERHVISYCRLFAIGGNLML